MRKLYFRVMDRCGYHPPLTEISVRFWSRELVLEWIFKHYQEFFSNCSGTDYPLTVEVYANPNDTEPLFVGEIREVVTHEFTVKESK